MRCTTITCKGNVDEIDMAVLGAGLTKIFEDVFGVACSRRKLQCKGNVDEMDMAVLRPGLTKRY